MKKLKTILPVLTLLVMTLSVNAQNTMQLSGYQANDTLSIEDVYANINSDVIDTLYKYRNDLTHVNRLKIIDITNEKHNDIVNKINDLDFNLSNLALTFGEVVGRGSNGDVRELAVRVHNEKLIDEGNFTFETGDDVVAYITMPSGRSQWSVVTYEVAGDGYHWVKRANNLWTKADYYLIYKR